MLLYDNNLIEVTSVLILHSSVKRAFTFSVILFYLDKKCFLTYSNVTTIVGNK